MLPISRQQSKAFHHAAGGDAALRMSSKIRIQNGKGRPLNMTPYMLLHLLSIFISILLSISFFFFHL